MSSVIEFMAEYKKDLYSSAKVQKDRNIANILSTTAQNIHQVGIQEDSQTAISTKKGELFQFRAVARTVHSPGRPKCAKRKV